MHPLTVYHQTQSPSGAESPSAGPAALNAEIYTQDGDYIRDIEVNDLRNRYTLTKGSTQKMVNTHYYKSTDTPRPSISRRLFFMQNTVRWND